MNFDNGHRQRQGQHNKRGRGRSNRRPGGGGGGGQHGGGHTINRVYESNGPDVKVRGTAQTIAEKYMQLGRDAHSAGDNVMAESYYQFAEHYFRVLQSVQPPGQLAPQILRRPGEEAEEEVEAGEGEESGQAAEGGEAGEAGAAASGEYAEGGVATEAGQQDGQPPRQDRQRDLEGRDNRDGSRERFRPRWQQRRNERGPDGQQGGQQGQERQPGDSEDSRQAASEQPEAEGNWEAPSFLTRPVPVPVASPAEGEAESQGERRPARTRRPRAVAEDPSDPIPSSE